MTPRRDSYERRRPDETLLYQLIEEHWPTFLERAEQSGGLPDFIVEEFEAYLRCGMLEVIAKQPARHPWAWLLQRVFAVDIMTCPRCRGAMRLMKLANKPDDIARVLAELGSVPVRLRGRGQPQLASSTSPRDRPTLLEPRWSSRASASRGPQVGGWGPAPTASDVANSRIWCVRGFRNG